MRIVIVGAGEVGYSVAKNLSEIGHDIVVIEENELRAAEVDDDLDVIVIRGNASRPSVLAKAGIKAGGGVVLLIACTNKDEVNIMACWIAKRMGVPHVIARAVGLEFTDNGNWARELGIDMLISPERSVASEIEELLEVRGAFQATEIANGLAGIYGFRITEDSPAVGPTLHELRKLHPKLVVLVVCIQRGERCFVPTADETIQLGDICYTICYRDQVQEAAAIFRPSHSGPLRRIFIIGGGKVGCQTAQRLLKRISDIKICLIDSDQAKCRRVSAEMPELLVICGDGADSDLLNSEGISSADGFISATDHDETNLMLAVLGKTLGAAKSIAVVKRPNYLGMTNYIPVDAIVNRNQALADIIIKNVRYPGSAQALTVFNEINAEALELTLKESSPSVGRSMKELQMPHESIIGLIERGGKLLIPTGETRLEAGDKIIVFASSDVMTPAIKQLGEESK